MSCRAEDVLDDRKTTVTLFEWICVGGWVGTRLSNGAVLCLAGLSEFMETCQRNGAGRITLNVLTQMCWMEECWLCT